MQEVEEIGGCVVGWWSCKRKWFFGQAKDGRGESVASDGLGGVYKREFCPAGQFQKNERVLT